MRPDLPGSIFLGAKRRASDFLPLCDQRCCIKVGALIGDGSDAEALVFSG